MCSNMSMIPLCMVMFCAQTSGHGGNRNVRYSAGKFANLVSKSNPYDFGI